MRPWQHVNLALLMPILCPKNIRQSADVSVYRPLLSCSYRPSLTLFAATHYGAETVLTNLFFDASCYAVCANRRCQPHVLRAEVRLIGFGLDRLPNQRSPTFKTTNN